MYSLFSVTILWRNILTITLSGIRGVNISSARNKASNGLIAVIISNYNTKLSNSLILNRVCTLPYKIKSTYHY